MAGKQRLDLVVVNPAARTQNYQALGETLAAVEPPVWAGMIATFIRRRDFSVEVIDSEAEGLTVEQTAARITTLAPVLVAVVVYGHQPSASTQNMIAAGAVCTAVKQATPETKVVLVGGHVAALPQRTLEEEDADFVSGGEGPYTVLELLQVLTSSRPDEYQKVRGLWYRDGDDIATTLPAPLLRGLDQEMPGVAWDLLPMSRYRAHNWHCFGHLERQPYAAIYTTLGCPYHCSFCCIHGPFKSGEKELGYREAVNSYRFWSPDAVIAQIDTLVNDYGIRNIKIADEMFVLNRKHIEGICERIIQRGYDLNIWAYARVDTVKDGMVDTLRRAGVTWLAFGIEAGSERVRATVDKRFEQDDIFRVVAEVRDAGINVIGNYIFGLPEDDHESMQATLDLALELNCEFANFYSTMAYPGSQLYAVAMEEGWALPEQWTGYSQHSVDTLPLPTRHVSAGEVLSFRDHAFHGHFSSPRYLDMITRKFGAKTTQHIREMAGHKLVRKYAA